MPQKWLSSYSLAPMTPRDAKLTAAHPNLLHAIKWGSSVSEGVVKDYIIGIKSRITKLKRYVDPATSPTWSYSNPVVSHNSYDITTLLFIKMLDPAC